MIRLISIIAVFTLMAGCAADSSGPSTQPLAAGHAECLVCKHNADLACVDVKIEADTAMYLYMGKPYYFCSPTCRNEFAQNPAKYLPH